MSPRTLLIALVAGLLGVACAHEASTPSSTTASITSGDDAALVASEASYNPGTPPAIDPTRVVCPTPEPDREPATASVEDPPVAASVNPAPAGRSIEAPLYACGIDSASAVVARSNPCLTSNETASDAAPLAPAQLTFVEDPNEVPDVAHYRVACDGATVDVFVDVTACEVGGVAS